MPITLKKQAFNLPGPQTVTLTPDECQRLYGGAKTVYDYAPVGCKQDPSQWDTVDWKAFETQFTQLCEVLKTICKDGTLFFTDEEGRDPKNNSLYTNQRDYRDRYIEMIETFRKDVLFHSEHTNSLYASQSGKPVFFEELKNALEVIVLELQNQVQKLKDNTPYEIADKASTLKLFDETVREATVCDEGAHIKLISLKNDLRKIKGAKNIVALQLDGVFTRIASQYVTRPSVSQGHHVHMAPTFKNLAKAMGIFPEEMPYAEDRYSSKITINEEGEGEAREKVYLISESNLLALTEVDLNLNFRPEFDRLFNATTVVANLADHIAGNVLAIYGQCEGKNNTREAMNDALGEVSELMQGLGLEHEFGFYDAADDDYNYYKKSPLEVYYWAHVYACKALEKEQLVDGLEREKLGGDLWLCTDGMTQWFENEEKNLVQLDDVIRIYGLEKNLSRLNKITSFGLTHALMETAKEGPLKDALKAKRSALKLKYNFEQLQVDRPYFCFDSIDDLLALKKQCEGNLYFLSLVLEKASRSEIQELLFNGLKNEKTRLATNQFISALNTADPPRDLVESGIPLKREDLSIYIPPQFVKHLFTLSEYEAADMVPAAWLGHPPKKIPQNIWAMKDYASIRENIKGNLIDIFEFIPSMVDMYFITVPEDERGEALAFYYAAMSKNRNQADRKLIYEKHRQRVREKAAEWSIYQKVLKKRANIITCLHPEQQGQLYLDRFEDIESIWDAIDNKDKVIAVLVSYRDPAVNLDTMLAEALLNEKTRELAKVIIGAANIPIDYSILDAIIQANEDPLAALEIIPASWFSQFREGDLTKLVVNLKSFEMIFNQSSFFRDGTTILSTRWAPLTEWLHDPADFIKLCRILSLEFKEKDNDVWNRLRDGPILTLLKGGITVSFTGDSDPFLQLAHWMIDTLFDRIMEKSGDADAILKSWGIFEKGDESLDAMGMQDTPYFEVYRRVHLRVMSKLHQVDLVKAFNEIQPVSTAQERQSFNDQIDGNQPGRLYLAVESLNDIPMRHHSLFSRAYLPPLQRLFLEGMLNPETRADTRKILDALSEANASQYLTQEHMESAIDNADPTLLPARFHPMIGDQFVELKDHLAIEKFLTETQENYHERFSTLIAIHPGIALRFLTNVPEGKEFKALEVTLGSLALCKDIKVVNEVHRLINDKIGAIVTNLSQLIVLMTEIKLASPKGYETEFCLLSHQVLNAHPEMNSHDLIVQIVSSHRQADPKVLEAIVKEVLINNPITSFRTFINLLPVIIKIPRPGNRQIVSGEAVLSLLKACSFNQFMEIFRVLMGVHRPTDIDDYIFATILRRATREIANQVAIVVLSQYKETISFPLYTLLIREHHPERMDEDREQSFRTRKKSQNNALSLHNNSELLFYLEDFDDLLVAFEHINRTGPDFKSFNVMGSVQAMTSIDSLLSFASKKPFFNVKNLIAMMTKREEPLDYDFIRHIIQIFRREGDGIDVEDFNVIASQVTSNPVYSERRNEIHEFLLDTLPSLGVHAYLALTSPPVPEVVLLRDFFKRRRYSPDNDYRNRILSIFESWIRRFDVNNHEDKVLLETILSTYHDLRQLTDVDFTQSYNRIYLFSSFFRQSNLRDDPRFSMHPIARIVVHVFHDPVTDLFIDWAETDDRDSNFIPSCHHCANPFIGTLPDASVVTMSSEEFVKKYIDKPDLSLLTKWESIPVIAVRFKSMLLKRIQGDPSYAEDVLFPAFLAKISGDRSFFNSRDTFINQCFPSGHPVSVRLLTLSRFQRNSSDGQLNPQVYLDENGLSDFLSIMKGVDSVLSGRFMSISLMRKIPGLYFQNATDESLRKKMQGFLLLNVDYISQCAPSDQNSPESAIFYRDMYVLLCDVFPDKDLANTVFLQLCENFVPQQAIPILASMVSSLNLETVLNSISEKAWGPLLVELGLITPGQIQFFTALEFDMKASTGATLTNILRAYQASLPGPNRVDKAMSNSVGEPEFITKLRNFCDTQKPGNAELTQLKKLFVKHFGELYKRKCAGQMQGADPVVNAIVTRRMK